MLPWWLFLVTGIAWLLISLIVLRFDVTSIAAVGLDRSRGTEAS